MNNDSLKTKDSEDQNNELVSVPEVDTNAPMASVQLGDEISGDVMSIPELDTNAPMATVQKGLKPDTSSNYLSKIQKSYDSEGKVEE